MRKNRILFVTLRRINHRTNNGSCSLRRRGGELVWNGKTNEVCNIVLSFQAIEVDGASDSGKVQGIQKPPSKHVIRKLEELFTNSFSVGVIHFSHEGQSCNGWVVEGAPHDQGCNPNLPA